MGYLKEKVKGVDDHTLEVLFKSSYSVFVKIIGLAMAMFSSVLLGRALGVEGFGIVELALQITTFLMILSAFGMPQLILKEVAIALGKGDWDHVRNSMYTSIIFNGILSALISFIIFLLSPYVAIEIFDTSDLVLPLRIMSFGIFFQTLSRCLGSGINGLGKVWQSNLIDQSLSMILLVVFLLVSKLIFGNISLEITAYAYLLARFGVTMTIGYYCRSIFKANYSSSSVKKIQRSFLKPASQLLIANGSVIIATSVSTIFLGILSSTKEVGLFNVASRVALLIIVFLQISNSALSPKIASLFKQGRVLELQTLLTRITSLLFLIGVASLAVFILAGKQILGIWGEEFQEAYLYLLILSVGQLVNLSTGAVGIILIMTGHEKIVGRVSLVTMLLSIFLNFAFIKIWGGLGACIATSSILIFENLLKLKYSRKYTGLNTITLKF